MTRSVAVGPQAPIPNAVKAVPPRVEGTQGDAMPAKGTAEAEFSELLSELQMARGRPPQNAEAAPTGQQGRHAAQRDALARQHGYGPTDEPETDGSTTPGDLDALELTLTEGADAASESVAKPVDPNGNAAAATPSAVDANAAAAMQPPAAASDEAVAPEMAANPRTHASPAAEIRAASELAPVAKEQVAPKEEKRAAQPAQAEFDIGSDEASDPPQPAKSASAASATVVKQETHFEPVREAATAVRDAGAAAPRAAKDAGMPTPDASQPAPAVETAAGNPQQATAVPPRPAQQIADRIAAEASFLDSASQVAFEPAQSGSSSPVKVLQIQLQPADLGTVTVRLELKQSELEVHVEASRAETADMLRSDKDALSNLLRSAGYNVDAGSIRVVEGDRSGATGQGGQQGAQGNQQSAAQSDSGGAQRDADARQGGAGGHNDGAPQTAERGEGDGRTAPRAGGGLYV